MFIAIHYVSFVANASEFLDNLKELFPLLIHVDVCSSPKSFTTPYYVTWGEPHPIMLHGVNHTLLCYTG